MKQLAKILAVLCVPLFLINCGDDETTPLDALVGEWQSTSMTFSGCPDSDDDGIRTCDPYCQNIEINADGTYTLQEANFETQQIESQSGTITVTSTTILLCETGETCNGDDPATYVRTSDTSMTITFDDDGCDIAIVFTKQ